MSNSDGLTLRGRMVPNYVNEKRAREAAEAETQRQAEADAAIIRKQKAMNPTSLQDELVAEFHRLVGGDSLITKYRKMLEDMKYRSNRTKIEIRARERYLRNKAADHIRQRHGIRVIPGYNDRQFTYRAEIAALSPQLKELLDRLGVVLPAEIDPEPPASEPQSTEQNP